MRDIFDKMPPAISRQVFLRIGTAIVAFILFVSVTVIFNNIYLSTPCIILFAIMIVNTLSLIYNCVKGNYIAIEGLCSDVEVSKIRKKTKAFELKVDEYTLYFPINKRIGKVNTGDTVIIYLSDKTLLYEQDGKYVVYEYYAIEVKERNYEFTKRKII